jgi:beta-N-acetylhexosaminidase
MKRTKKILAAALGCSLLLTACGRDATSSSSKQRERTTFQWDFPEENTTFSFDFNFEINTTTPNQPGTITIVTNPADNPAQSTTTALTTTAVQTTAAATTQAQTSKAETVLTTAAVTTTLAATTTAVTTTYKAGTPEAKLAEMSLRQKVCQLFIVTPEQLTGLDRMVEVKAGTRSALKNYPVGGFIYLSQNIYSEDQIKKMLSDTQTFLKESCGIGGFTAVDEEGGEIVRVGKNLDVTPVSDMAEYGERNDSDEAFSVGKTLGSNIKKYGFNLDLAPVADVNINDKNELGKRIFSSDPKVVANMASNVVKGLKDAGVCSTAKHFPGLGAESGNTHNDSKVVIQRTLEQLRATEFVPFKACIDAGVDFIMVGHQITTGFGDNLPGDLSKVAMTDILRGELGFKGIIITDAQKMNTISKVYSSGTAAKLSIKAGADMILSPSNLNEAVNALITAVESGEIPESRIDESVLRILTLKKKLGLF